ncbi:WD40 repeat domain-containing protein [Candidatus Viridilinea mediisalina]|uniref:Uncharacterized protein n=1 Tax=Candidatus Viridilinea mediisalina TaxID=2024553 RepID=A0A2A6RM91_9CHLR|nr:WD40 repeat domain-containing protein [Candidatus Viridilinea mediisalina]PDW03980.1 hypothetical protein CJ255_05820 [Candidatus Viridilinea mediisalina]
MPDLPDLELGIHRWDVGSYAVELRRSHLHSETESHVSGRMTFAASQLLAQTLDHAAYGRSLGAYLFQDRKLYQQFIQARSDAYAQDLPLRVRLLIGPSAPELHSLRWELLCDPDDIATQALANANSVPDLAALLSVEAYRRGDEKPDIRSIVRSSLYGVLSANNNLRTFLGVEGTNVTSLAFHKDGNILVAGDNQGVLYFWDVVSGELIREPVRSNDCHCDINSIAISPNGNTVAVGSSNRNVVLFNLHTDEQLAPVATISHHVRSVAFHPQDNDQVAFAGNDGNVYLWRIDHRSGDPIALTGHEGSVRRVAFSPDDGSILASSSNDGSVRLWNSETGAAIGEPLRTFTTDGVTNTTSVTTLAFSSNGRTLVSSQDRDIYLWDLTAEPVALKGSPLIGHTGWINDLIFVPGDNNNDDNNHLISVSGDLSMLIWDLNERRPLFTYSAHVAPINAVAISADRTLIATGGADSQIVLWSYDRPAWLGQRTFEGRVGYRGLALALPDENTPLALISREYSDDSSVDYSIRRADQPRPADADIRATPPLTNTRSVALSPDGQLIAVGFRDGRVQLWNAEGEEIEPPLQLAATEGSDPNVWTLAFSSDSRRLAWGNNDGRIVVWDLDQPSQPALELPYGRGDDETPIGHTARITALAFSPDGSILVSGSSDNQVFLWNLTDASLLSNPLDEGNEEISSLAFSPQGDLLAAGGVQSVFLIDVNKGERIAAPLVGHRALIVSLAFNSNGSMLASGSRDQTIVLWDVAARRRFGYPLRTSSGSSWIRALAFRNDEELFVIQSFGFWTLDLRPEMWMEAACRLANRELTAAEWREYFGDEPQRPTCSISDE